MCMYPRNWSFRDERRVIGTKRPGVAVAGVCNRRDFHVLHLPGSRRTGRRVPHSRIILVVGNALLGRIVGFRPRLEVSLSPQRPKSKLPDVFAEILTAAAMLYNG
ncbi:hypothetical protein J3459_015942 [Metarhizium acridum]|nr:hypothetical protein J3459_015942 [Metarhizium acridum]